MLVSRNTPVSTFVVAPVGTGKSTAALRGLGTDIDSLLRPLSRRVSSLRSAKRWNELNALIRSVAMDWARAPSALTDRVLFVHSIEHVPNFGSGARVAKWILPQSEWIRRLAVINATDPGRAEAMITNRSDAITDPRLMRLPDWAGTPSIEE